MMTLSVLAQSAGGSAPLNPTDVLAMSVSDLSTEELITRVDGLIQMEEAVGLLRAKYLREIRDRDYPITGRVGDHGKETARKGWDEFLKGRFGAKLTVSKCNAEIRGLESLEAAAKALGAANSDEFGDAPAHVRKSIQISNTLLEELGKANGCGSKVAKRILKGEISGKRQVRKAVKEAQEKAKLAGIKDVQRAAPKAASKPTTPKVLPMSGEEKTYSLAKWRKVPEQAEELEWVQKHLEKMRKAAVAYRNSCKQLEDRMAQGIAANRNHPALMTVFATIWNENGFDFDAALQDVVDELAEANRLWGLAMPLCHGSAKIIE